MHSAMAMNLCCAAIFVVSCGFVSAILQKNYPASGLGDNDWDYLLFVHRWPPSVCTKSVSVENGEKCIIPDNLSTQDWVMHGIWPTKTGTEGPVNCDPNLPWDPSTLKALLSDLEVYWPNLEANTPYDSFWQHEYVKHGSCALNFPPLVGEINFFTKPLDLRKQFQLYQALASQNISPSSTKRFSHDQIIQALQVTYGKKSEAWCSYDKATKLHYVQEIRFCLDKSFNMFDCPDAAANLSSGTNLQETSKCPKTAELAYPPLKPSRQRHPKHKQYHHLSKWINK